MTTEIKYQVIEDSGGGLSLFVFCGSETVFAHSGYEYNQGQLSEDLDALDAGDDTSSWDGNETDILKVEDITEYEYGWELVAWGQGGKRTLNPDVMGVAARLEFGIKDE